MTQTRAEKRVVEQTGKLAGVEVAVLEVKEYEDGKVAGHEGPVAGRGPLHNPGILAVDAELTTPAGRFTGCIRVRDYAPLTKAEGIKF